MIQQHYDDDKKHVHVLSYGGGTQSTALLLMALRGEVRGVIPDYIIFSDTGWEPQYVYDWVEKVNDYIKKEFNREIVFTSAGSIREDLKEHVNNGKRMSNIPFFTKAPNGKKGMSLRQCTREYKIRPVTRKVRELMGYTPNDRVKEQVHMWKGISTDEIERVKPAQQKYITAEHPLVDFLDMDRDDCIKYVEDLGLGTPAKSSCIGCPFHSDAMWMDMKINDPESWKDAVEMDEVVRKMPNLVGKAYLHRSCVPLEEVIFYEQSELDEFINECEGFCGT